MSFKIIPEDAGNTLDVVEQQLLRQDHPRGCGEHRLRMMKPMVLSGSSPRMQGARGGMQRTLRPVRIIPADAGSTRTC